jgi:hypothetical protein
MVNEPLIAPLISGTEADTTIGLSRRLLHKQPHAGASCARHREREVANLISLDEVRALFGHRGVAARGLAPLSGVRPLCRRLGGAGRPAGRLAPLANPACSWSHLFVRPDRSACLPGTSRSPTALRSPPYPRSHCMTMLVSASAADDLPRLTSASAHFKPRLFRPDLLSFR